MKTRTGFVSNSSTSSFVCVVAKADHEKAIATLTDEQRKAFETTLETDKIGDLDVVYFGSMTVMDGETQRTGENPDDMKFENDAASAEFYDNRYKGKDNYKKALRAMGAKFFETSFDM